MTQYDGWQGRRMAAWWLGAAAGFIWLMAGPAHGAMELMRGDDAKHTPVISAPDKVKAGEPFEVKISVGKTMHPSLPDHMIQSIQLLADEVSLAFVTLSPVVTVPVVTVTVTLQQSATLRALAQPNHSAPWEATKKIEVEPAAKKE